MKYRLPLAAASVTAVLLATGLAWADGSSDSSRGSSSTANTTSTSSTSTSSTSTSSTSTSSTSTSSTSTSPTVTSPTVTSPTNADPSASRANSTESIADGTSQTFVIENAGTVIVGRTGGSLRIIVATPNAGWASEVEVASGREVEGDFRSGAFRVKYNFELEDGTVRVRIETRDDANDRDRDFRHNDNASGGPGSADDDNRDTDDDNSGPGSGDDDNRDADDDNRGPGSGDDDNRDSDDDNRGPGSRDDDDSGDDD